MKTSGEFADNFRVRPRQFQRPGSASGILNGSRCACFLHGTGKLGAIM
jgi:hypothetical protein